MEKVVTKANERLAESLQGLYDQESRAKIYKTRCEQINARLAISQRNLDAQRACDQRLAQGRLEQIAAAAKKKEAAESLAAALAARREEEAARKKEEAVAAQKKEELAKLSAASVAKGEGAAAKRVDSDVEMS